MPTAAGEASQSRRYEPSWTRIEPPSSPRKSRNPSHVSLGAKSTTSNTLKIEALLSPRRPVQAPRRRDVSEGQTEDELLANLRKNLIGLMLHDGPYRVRLMLYEVMKELHEGEVRGEDRPIESSSPRATRNNLKERLIQRMQMRLLLLGKSEEVVKVYEKVLKREPSEYTTFPRPRGRNEKQVHIML